MRLEVIAQIAVQPDVVEEIVALEDAVVLHHPVVFVTHKRLEDGGGNVRVVKAAQRVANVV